MITYHQFKINEPCISNYNFNFKKFIEDIKYKFTPKIVGNNKLGKNEINKEIRSCQQLSNSIDLHFGDNSFFNKFAEFLEEPEPEELFVPLYFLPSKYFDLLKYEEGDFFKAHQDSKSNDYHIGTILIYPPKNICDYEGGELYLSKEDITIKAYENDWSMVLLHINTLHEVKPITKGTRYVFKQQFNISESVKVFLESKLCNYIELSEDNINQGKNREELELEIKYYEDILTNLKKEKYALDNIDRCNTMVNDIIETVKKNGVKIVCQNYYETPTLDKLTGLDKNIIASIQKQIGKEIKIRMFNYDGQIRIGKSFSKWNTIPSIIDDDNGEELDITNQEFYYLPFHHYDTFRISYDNMLTGNYQGILSEYNDEEYENYLLTNVTIIIIYK